MNVGCIPKKLMHYASMLGDNSHHMKYSGWNVDKSELKHDWGALVKKIQLHIKVIRAFLVRNSISATNRI